MAISDYTGAVDAAISRTWDAYCPTPGTIAIEADGRTSLSIYSIDATEQWSGIPAAGTTLLHLPRGIYIVTTPTTSKKVVVR